MTKKELISTLEYLVAKARSNMKACRDAGHATDESYERGKLDAYEIILHNLKG